jgi:TolB-like protein
MMRRRTVVPAWAVLLTVLVLHPARADARSARVWILPFDNLDADASTAHLEEALPALLTVALSQADRHAVVDRQHLEQVLAELALTLHGLTAPESRREVGRLLGATVMLGGSFARRGPELLVSMRAIDVETARVMASAEARGPADRLGRLVGELYRRVAGHLGQRLPELGADQIDEAPVANLHFMRGLAYYYSARPNHALAEFLQAALDAQLTDIARLWLANAYLAQEQYGHAYFELSRLGLRAPRGVGKAEVEAKLRICERALSAETAKMIRDLAAPRVPAKD